MGLCVDSEGLVVLLDNSVPGWLPHEQFKDFRVHLVGEGGEGYEAIYLGRDYLNGWHYLRVAEELWDRLVPVSQYSETSPGIGTAVWGIGMMGKDFDFQPYLLNGRLAMTQQLPLKVGFSEALLGIPGGPVFDWEGNFAGWIGAPLTREKILSMGSDQYNVGVRSVRESGVFLFAEDFLKNVGNVPESPDSGPWPWVGIAGMQPIDREVAGFLGLRDQGAVVISTVLENAPAEKGGLKSKDIVLGIDGDKLPKFRPEGIVQRYLERQVLLHSPGETIRFNVMRGDENIEVEIEVGNHPKPLNLAERQYLADLGLTVREFVVVDAIRRQVPHENSAGVIAAFVKPNSPVNTAGLREGDWIKAIDGREIEHYEEAIALLSTIETDELRNDFVMLIDRNRETSVLRVKLK